MVGEWVERFWEDWFRKWVEGRDENRRNVVKLELEEVRVESCAGFSL
jgi:hypothetical protein